MAGYEYPTPQTQAARLMMAALIGARAALVAEATQRGEEDADYEFPAAPAIAAINEALVAASAAFGLRIEGASVPDAPPFPVDQCPDTLSGWLAGVFDRVDRFFGRLGSRA